MNRQEIHELLDKSCADALDNWWELQNKTPLPEKSLAFKKELEQRLGSLQKPNYDCEYIMSAYVVIYQIKQINMAWNVLSALKQVRGLGTRSRDSIRIVDLGAGTSAGRIGAALMVAEAIGEGRSIDSIYFDEIDASTPMLEMGELLWQAFSERVHFESDDIALALAVDAFDSSSHKDWKELEVLDFETWLTAFHVIYPGYNDLRVAINGLYQQMTPIAGAFSCHQGNSGMMQAIFPSFDMRVPLPVPLISDKCPTSYISDWAERNGFISRGEYQRGWRPYLHVKDCTLLYGFNVDQQLSQIVGK